MARWSRPAPDVDWLKILSRTRFPCEALKLAMGEVTPPPSVTDSSCLEPVWRFGREEGEVVSAFVTWTAARIGGF